MVQIDLTEKRFMHFPADPTAHERAQATPQEGCEEFTAERIRTPSEREAKHGNPDKDAELCHAWINPGWPMIGPRRASRPHFSSSPVSEVPPVTVTFSMMALDSFSAISGLSLSACLAASRPWPTRLPS